MGGGTKCLGASSALRGTARGDVVGFEDRMPDPSESQVAYLPYEDNTQTAREIAGYSRTLTRTPLKAFVTRPLTLSELTAPTGLRGKLTLGTNNLHRPAPGG